MLLKRLSSKTISLLLVVALAINLCACASTEAGDGDQAIDSETVTNINEEELASELMQDDDSASKTVDDTGEDNEVEEESDNTDTEETDTSSGFALNENLLDNGDFHSDMAHWGTYTAKGGNCVFTAPGGEGKVSITNSGNVNYAVQAFYDGFELKNGGVYEFSFKMSSDKPRNIEARIQINGGDYHAYVDIFEDIDENMNTYSTTFTMEEGSDPAPRLCFNLGTPEGEDELGEHVVKFDDVSLKLVDASGIKEAVVEDLTVSININQVGYLKDSVKIAMSNSSKVGDSFKVVDVKSGKTCFEGKYDTEVYSKGAGENVVRGDFSALKEEGTYRIEDATGASYEFKVGDKVYNDLLKDAFRFLYTQRCGIEIEEKYAGSYAHRACHTGEATIHGTNNKKKVTGGWHDAGDYGRYVVP
ncbi:MAG: cellulase N-terminal Ig-like domain-containing protein, partial [Lachnospiraceae bacterium]|nr:cellulase N-terminal Ig-like domain-containing protein [Lachnospiraceae bacterium]